MSTDNIDLNTPPDFENIPIPTSDTVPVPDPVPDTMLSDITIVTGGSVDSGKSTFLGYLITGKLDDGNGLTRKSIAKHPHEITTGRTSDISSRTLKLDNKLITFVDLCGHEKYLKTTTFGITGYFPDYAVVVISANRGVLKMTKEHLGILVNMNIPIVIAVSRVDISPNDIYDNTILTLKKLFSKSCKRLMFVNSNTETKFDENVLKKAEEKSCVEMIKLADDMSLNPHIIPVITISNKTGYYLSVIKSLLFNLKPRKIWKDDEVQIGSIFYIDSTFKVDGVGVVISGIVKGKTIKTGDTLLIGPHANEFVEIIVRSIHNNNKEKINELKNQQRGCFAIRVTDKKIELNRENITKGMVAVSSKELTETIAYKFRAKIEVLNHSTTICNRYSTVIHCGTVRQSARLIMPETQTLKTKDIAEVEIKFKQRPEFLEVGSKFFFRDGLTKGTGDVLEITPLSKDSHPFPDQIKSNCGRRRQVVQQRKPVLNII